MGVLKGKREFCACDMGFLVVVVQLLQVSPRDCAQAGVSGKDPADASLVP